MPETKTYTGGCHCGRVRYEVTTDLADRDGVQLLALQQARPAADLRDARQFKALAGDDGLNDYQFNKKMIHHLLCPDLRH